MSTMIWRSLFSRLFAVLCTVWLLPTAAVAELPAGINWYGVLDEGLAEAARTERPILLLSAAPQCAGVPGMW
jgi:hypothetical protein